ncbi:MAG: hypothetical protein K2X74_00410 [Acetobacteraceae bacterium]|nr:hypothetical protein [Acetobacteraceae bacterium]
MPAAPLRLSAVLHVAERLRERDRVEIFARAWPGQDHPERLAMEVLMHSRFGATIHATDGEPVAALGLTPVLPGIYSAWMFSTDRWGEVWRSAARQAVRVIQPAAVAAGMRRAQCASLADHAEAHAFLRWIGFRAEGEAVPLGRDGERFIPFGWGLS